MPTYEEMGKAAMLVGMVRAREILDTEITKLQTELQEDPSKKTRGSGSRKYWAAMTKEQRGAEMQRRMKVSVARKFHGGTFLRNGLISTRGLKRGTKAYKEADAHNKRLQRATAKRAKTSPAQTGWNRMSVRQRKARLAAMLAGKAAKQALVNGEATA